MFCSNCGENLQEGSAFCASCGTKVAGVKAKKSPKPATPMSETVMVRDFRCNGCGTPLKIPPNSSAPVRCPSCKTECVIERAVKNAEIAAKENIESGIPLSASPAKLHSVIVSVLSKSPVMPLDVFEKVEVIREEHYCVPAYAFHCNGTESFTYDVANVRQHKTVQDLGDRSRTEWENYEEWDNGKSSTAAVRQLVIVSGNRQLVNQLKYLYADLNHKKLIDIESLNFPLDVETCKADIPATTAFNEFAVPVIEKALKEKAQESLAKQKTRDLQMGGSNIQKEVTRMFLSIYRVVFRYDNKEYYIWINGDGSKWYWNEGLPEDIGLKKTLEQRQRSLNEKIESMEEEVSSIPFASVGGIIAGLVLLIVGGTNINNPAPLGFGGIIICVTGVIIFGVSIFRSHNSYNEKHTEIRARHQREIESFESETSKIVEKAENIVRRFKSQKKALRGIYEKLSGNAEAFQVNDSSIDDGDEDLDDDDDFDDEDYDVD